MGIWRKKGIAINWNIDDKENTYYVRTMEMMNDFVANSIHIRTFVTAEYNTDGEAKTAIIYSENVTFHISSTNSKLFLFK